MRVAVTGGVADDVGRDGTANDQKKTPQDIAESEWLKVPARVRLT
jgi:hypothetical protein